MEYQRLCLKRGKQEKKKKALERFEMKRAKYHLVDRLMTLTLNRDCGQNVIRRTLKHMRHGITCAKFSQHFDAPQTAARHRMKQYGE